MKKLALSIVVSILAVLGASSAYAKPVRPHAMAVCLSEAAAIALYEALVDTDKAGKDVFTVPTIVRRNCQKSGANIEQDFIEKFKPQPYNAPYVDRDGDELQIIMIDRNEKKLYVVCWNYSLVSNPNLKKEMSL